ncbi:MAG: type IV secretion system DNA-binding domain-containing protein [Paludibacter sp.]|nr:type IV secretion system DNA-binding domain-containing protein [Paludibacter sp.]
MSLGEVTSLGGIIIKLIKSIFVFALLASPIIVEFHLFYFSCLHFLGIDYHGYLEPSFSGHMYSSFLFSFEKLFEKSSVLIDILTMLVIGAILYISFYYTKSKKFPRVIVGILINNSILYVSLALLLFLFSKQITHNTSITYIYNLLLILTLGIIALAGFLIYKKKHKRNTKPEKFTAAVKKTQESEFVFKTNSGDIHLKNPYRGIFIQGGAGSGKSVSLFEPIIKQIGKAGFTGILYDFKSPELTNKLKISYQKSNVKVYNIDFKHPYLSQRANPIDPKYLIKSAVAIEYAQVLINNLIPETIKKNDFWTNNAKMILAGVIWYLRNEYPEKCTIPHTISLILHNSVNELIEKVSQDYEAGGMVASLRESIERGSEKTVAGMLSTLQNALSILNSQDIFWILSGNDVDLHLNNPENPSMLCLGNDSTLPGVYSPIISLITAVSLKQMNRPNQEKSIILLDEAPTIFIPNIEQIPATARSNRIATVFGVQDMSQLIDKYGKDKSEVIISNLGNQFFGRTTNTKTGEMIQHVFSKTDKVFVSKSEGSGTNGKFIHLGSNMNEGFSENVQERDRVKVRDLINLSSGEFYGIIAEGTPREFLKVQFEKGEIDEIYIDQRIPINDVIMKDNYFRIIKECKDIFLHTKQKDYSVN